MEDELKTREQLLKELGDLRRHVALLQASEAAHEKTQAMLLDGQENYRSILESSPS